MKLSGQVILRSLYFYRERNRVTERTAHNDDGKESKIFVSHREQSPKSPVAYPVACTDSHRHAYIVQKINATQEETSIFVATGICKPNRKLKRFNNFESVVTRCSVVFCVLRQGEVISSSEMKTKKTGSCYISTDCT